MPVRFAFGLRLGLVAAALGGAFRAFWAVRFVDGLAVRLGAAFAAWRLGAARWDEAAPRTAERRDARLRPAGVEAREEPIRLPFAEAPGIPPGRRA